MIKNSFLAIILTTYWISPSMADFSKTSSYDACRSQLPAGPFKFSADGKTVIAQQNLDSNCKFISWDEKTGVLLYESKFLDRQFGTQHLRKLTFSKDSSGRIVVANFTDTYDETKQNLYRKEESYYAVHHVDENTFTFLPGNPDQCVLQEVAGPKNIGHMTEHVTSFDLQQCKDWFDFGERFPKFASCRALSNPGDESIQSISGYDDMEDHVIKKIADLERKKLADFEDAKAKAQDVRQIASEKQLLNKLHRTGEGIFTQESLSRLSPMPYSDCVEQNETYKRLSTMADSCRQREDYVKNYFLDHPKYTGSDVKYYERSNNTGKASGVNPIPN